MRPGDRIRLVYTSDPYTNLKPGDEGSVGFVDDAGTVHVNWDNGARLGLIPGEYQWETIAVKNSENFKEK